MLWQRRVLLLNPNLYILLIYNPRWFCIFCCSDSHPSAQCKRYQSSNQFWQKVLVDRRCRNCLRLFHRADKCYNESLCPVKGCKRQDKHNSVLCNLRYKSNKFWSNAYKRHFDNPFPHLNTRDHHFSNYRTCKGSSKLSAVSKVHVSTQTEIELSTEPPREKISRGCQTDDRLANVSVCTQTSGSHVDICSFNCKKFPVPYDSSFNVTKNYRRSQSQQAEVFQSVLSIEDTRGSGGSD